MSSTSRTVLVTGAAGFLGRYAIRQFEQEGWRVVGLDDVPEENAPVFAGGKYLRMKLPDPQQFAAVLRAERPAVCVHCAGRASVPLSMSDPRADFHGNTVLTFEILEALRQHAPQCRFLLLSSAAVYGNPHSLPVSESHPTAPLSPYGFHKRQCELLCEEFFRIYGVPTASLRIFSAYGPGLRRQVIWDICRRVAAREPLTLHGTGAESRDFIHATDVARALVLLSEQAPCDGAAYNLASGAEVTIAQLAEMIISALGAKMAPIFDGVSRSGDPLNWRADIGRISDLGFRPSIPLDQGVRAVAGWASAELSSAL